MNNKPIPEPWAHAMIRLGFAHRGAPSISRLAEAAGISMETARRYVHGVGQPEPATTAALSTAMREDVSTWAGQQTAGAVYVGPDSSRLLDDRQRGALTELINAFVKGARHNVVMVDTSPDVEIPTARPDAQPKHD